MLADLRERWCRWSRELPPARGGPTSAIVSRRYPIDVQERFGREAAAAIGFDFGRGRLDVTAHPFCTGLGPHDCRITTRYDEHFFNSRVLRHAARGGTRHLRPGAADRAVRPAAGRGGLAGHSRIAIADVGKPGRPQPGVLGALLSRPRSRPFPRRWATSRSTIFTSPSTTCGRR